MGLDVSTRGIGGVDGPSYSPEPSPVEPSGGVREDSSARIRGDASTTASESAGIIYLPPPNFDWGQYDGAEETEFAPTSQNNLTIGGPGNEAAALAGMTRPREDSLSHRTSHRGDPKLDVDLPGGGNSGRDPQEGRPHDEHPSGGGNKYPSLKPQP
jgi:hypothetical protein